LLRDISSLIKKITYAYQGNYDGPIVKSKLQIFAKEPQRKPGPCNKGDQGHQNGHGGNDLALVVVTVESVGVSITLSGRFKNRQAMSGEYALLKAVHGARCKVQHRHKKLR